MTRNEKKNYLQPGTRVRVRQTLVVADRPDPWGPTIEGTVVAATPDTTGSWYAHGKHCKLWLLRLRVRKDDGEMTDLVIDRGSEVEILGSPESQAAG